MSVKISRREEKRDTSIRDFSLAAVLPLLLTGLIGFFIGEAGKVDTRVSSGELAIAQDSLRQANRQLNEMSWLVGELDSLLEAFTTAHDSRKSEFSQVAVADLNASPFDNPLDLWISAELSDFVDFRRAVSELEGTVAGRKIIPEAEARPLFDLFRQLNQQGHNFFAARLNAFRSQTTEERNLTETLTEQQDDCEDKIEALTGELQIADRKLQIKDLDIANLQSRLAENGSPEVIDPVSYQQEKSAITGAVMEIESISRQLPSGILVSNKKKEEIEADILKQVGLIKNALAVIE